MSVRILIGDCLIRMRELADNSVDSVVCDPPYHLASISKRWTNSPRTESTMPSSGPHRRVSRGFMGQTWDGGDVAFQPETWAEVLRVLKPGGHLIAFSGTRTYHRMAVAIEDAGFEVRDMISYHYGSGFPKSHNINKVLNGKELVCSCGGSQVSQRDLRLVPDTDVSEAVNTCHELGEVLFPAVSEQGLSSAEGAESAQGIADGAQPSLEGRRDVQEGARQLQGREVCTRSGMVAADGADERLRHGAPTCHGADVRLPADQNGSGEPQGSQPGEQSPVQPRALADERGSQAGGSWPVCDGCGKPIVAEGLGTALKPATEPICLARKPLSEATIAANVLKWGTGALNINATRIPMSDGEGISPRGSMDAATDIHEGWSRPWMADEAKSAARMAAAKERAETLGRWPANLCLSYPEDEYALRSSVTAEQRRELFGWLHANA